MIIVTDVVDIRTRQRNKVFKYICSDGIERNTDEIAKIIGVSKSTIINRVYTYGRKSKLISYRGRISTKLKQKHAIRKNKTTEASRPFVQPCTARSRKTGKPLPDNTTFDEMMYPRNHGYGGKKCL